MFLLLMFIVCWFIVKRKQCIVDKTRHDTLTKPEGKSSTHTVIFRNDRLCLMANEQIADSTFTMTLKSLRKCIVNICIATVITPVTLMS